MTFKQSVATNRLRTARRVYHLFAMLDAPLCCYRWSLHALAILVAATLLDSMVQHYWCSSISWRQFVTLTDATWWHPLPIAFPRFKSPGAPATKKQGESSCAMRTCTLVASSRFVAASTQRLEKPLGFWSCSTGWRGGSLIVRGTLLWTARRQSYQ
jgi:hypothetical protein